MKVESAQDDLRSPLSNDPIEYTELEALPDGNVGPNKLIGIPTEATRVIDGRTETNVLNVRIFVLSRKLSSAFARQGTRIRQQRVLRRATKRRRSSITELYFHGIHTLRQKAKSVTHVSGTICHLSLGPRRAEQGVR
jgi:hypothetical protein